MKSTVFAIKKVGDGWTCLYGGLVFQGKTAESALNKAFLFSGETDESGSSAEENGESIADAGRNNQPTNCS